MPKGQPIERYALRLEYAGNATSMTNNKVRSNWHRTFEIHSNATLEQLSLTILEILDWDKDHLYEFRVNNRLHTHFGTTEQFVYADEPCLSCDIPLRLLGLTTTNTFTFIFDFAYCHRFRLTLLAINSPSKTLTRATLTSHRGKPLHESPETKNPTLAALTEDPHKVLKLVRPANRWRARFIRTADKHTLIQWRKSNDKKLWQKAVTVLESWKRSPEEIAQKIEKNVDAVENWIKVFNNSGIAGLSAPRKVYSNATQRRTIREQKRHRILEIVHDRPHSFGINRSNRNLSSLALAYGQKYHEKISRSTASRFLRQSDYCMKKARKILSSPEPKYREKVDLLLQTLHCLKSDDRFFFVDELGPLRVKKYGGRMFLGKTERCSVPQVQLNRGAVTMAGALSATTNQMTWIYGPSKNTSTMIALLEILFNQHNSVARLYITWDAASWHRSGALVEWLDAFNEKTRQSRAGPLIYLVPLYPRPLSSWTSLKRFLAV